MFKKPFIYVVLENRNPAENWMRHVLLSNWKISSVLHPNTRAKVNARGRLGTYRLRSIELML